MDEVQSLGGPLICIERRLADQWRGVDGISIDPDASMAGVRTDYDRVCRMPNLYLSALRLRHGAGLILGDAPLETGVWKNALSQTIIWRVWYAEPDDHIPSLVASIPETSFANPVESIEFSFDSAKVLIFDTSLPGDEADAESVSFEIAPGRYLITTNLVTFTERARLVLHRFYPIS